MIPLHELLNRIHWNPEFGRGEFMLAYLDKVRYELVCVPLQEVHQEQGSHFCFRSLRIFGGRIRHDTPGKIPSTFHATMNTPLPILSLLETRVLGVLAEKQRTVPDTYPLTLIQSGCMKRLGKIKRGLFQIGCYA